MFAFYSPRPAKAATLLFLKLTSKLKLLPTPEEATLLLSTLQAANRCANWISHCAWKQRVFGTYSLHHLVYKQARTRLRLSAQMVVRAIAKVADAYRLDHHGQRAFATCGAHPYDDRLLSWNLSGNTVSLWTLKGRRTIRFVGGERQLRLLANRHGETDLIYQRGQFYLAATCEVEQPPATLPEDIIIIGIDVGVKQIATDSDGRTYSGSAVNHVRHRHRRLRTKLQKLGTRSAKRKLKKLSGKEPFCH
jgi:predicted transposase